MKTNDALLAERSKHIPQGPFNTHPIFVAKAKGALITDVEGKEYIDFAGGIGVNNVGHCDDEVLRVVSDQIQKYIHTCFHVVMYEPYVELAKKLPDYALRQFVLKNLMRDQTGRLKWKANLAVIKRHYPEIAGDITADGVFEKPTLFVKGSESRYILPDHSPRIQQLFPKSSIVTISGAGHWVHADRPEEFSNVVLTFLRS